MLTSNLKRYGSSITEIHGSETNHLLPPSSQQLSTDGEVGCFPSIVSNPFSLLIDLACAVALLLIFYAIPGRKVLALNFMPNDNLILPLPGLADLQFCGK